MKPETLTYANKLYANIKEAETVLSKELDLSVLVKHARKELEVISFLGEKEVEELKKKVRSSMVVELEKMKEEFESL